MKHGKKKMKENKMTGVESKKTESLTQDDVASETSSAPVKAPRSSRKKTDKVKAQPEGTDEGEETIPQLVPIEETPNKENGKMQENVTEKISPKKKPDPNTLRGKKRKAVPATETPGALGPGTSGKKTKKMSRKSKSPRPSSLLPRNLPTHPKAKKTL
ncbi:ribosomal L1 domain-containing protein 1 [Sigmodon hispidus]